MISLWQCPLQTGIQRGNGFEVSGMGFKAQGLGNSQASKGDSNCCPFIYCGAFLRSAILETTTETYSGGFTGQTCQGHPSFRSFCYKLDWA